MTSFILSGKRELLTEKTTQDLFDEFTKNNNTPWNSLTHIKMSGKSFGEEASKVAAKYFQQMTSLTHVDLSDIIAGRPEDEALVVLKNLSESLKDSPIIDLDLSDNALGLKGVEACSAILKDKNSLVHLAMNNCGLAAEAGERIREYLLFRGSDQSTPLKTLLFYNNLLNNGGASAISKVVACSPQLEKLRISATRFSQPASVDLANALMKISSLINLDISDNTFSSEALKTLSQAIQKQIQLTHLNLSDIGISKHSALFFSCIKNLKSIKVLNLAGNEISASDLTRDFYEAIKHFADLESLSLEENALGSYGAKLLSAALSPKIHTQLAYINLNENEIKALGAKSLANSSILQLPALKTFSLNSNMLPEDMIEKMKNQKSDVLGTFSDNEEDDEEEDEDEDLLNEFDNLKLED